MYICFVLSRTMNNSVYCVIHNKSADGFESFFAENCTQKRRVSLLRFYNPNKFLDFAQTRVQCIIFTINIIITCEYNDENTTD